MADPTLGTFTEIPFPPWRTLVSDTVRIGMKQHRIPILVEVDVTEARAASRRNDANERHVTFDDGSPVRVRRGTL